ncbi:MAG: hypothetical protein MOGMAGMI_00695 [Candidatus Omnitrophica bacterium]|nr:hypothetical protein [Candidatus Omnitrophota bacterium]
MKSRTKKDLTRFREDLRELLEGGFDEHTEDAVFSEMLYNVAQLRDEKLDMAEIRLINTAFKELRYALKVFKPFRDIPKAAVFGSARTPRSHPDFRFAEEFGRKLSRRGWMIITGGASGIMEAAMVGAGAQKSFGLNIMLPFEQSANPIIRGNEKLIFFKYFFTRKLMFLKESQATVLFPGGFGTFDEGFESFTLVQTGKARPRPLVLMDPPGSRFWSTFMDFVRTEIEGGKFISPRDLHLLKHCQSAGEAVDHILGFYDNYVSSRFLKDHFLIRLRRPIKDKDLEKLARKHASMIADGGGMRRFTDLAMDDDPDPALERIWFKFDRTSYSQLRLLIDDLNELGRPART